jgi:hypothetical protein
MFGIIQKYSTCFAIALSEIIIFLFKYFSQDVQALFTKSMNLYINNEIKLNFQRYIQKDYMFSIKILKCNVKRI